MEISPWLIYLVMQADSIIGPSIFFAIILGISVVIMTIILITMSCDGNLIESDAAFKRGIARSMKFIAPTFAFFLAVSVLMPSTKSLIAIVGIPAGIEIAKGLELDETTRKSIKLLNQYLDKELSGEGG